MSHIETDVSLAFIRHAESKIDPEIMCGRSNDIPLTGTGVEQARYLGNWLLQAHIAPGLVYTSPAQRCIQTVEHSLDQINLAVDPISDGALQGMDRGDWTRRKRDEVFTSEVEAEMEEQGKDFRAPGGESPRDVEKRIFSWAESAAAQSQQECSGQPIFAFTHTVTIRSMAARLCEWSWPESRQRPVPPTSVSLFIRRAGRWQLRFLGQPIDRLSPNDIKELF